MHTVVLSLCTGCELCVAPCPVDCITMVARASLADPPPAPTANDNRERFAAHNARLSARARQRAVLLTARKQAAGAAAAWPDEDSERAR
jgi:electron transport complex protein RnfB